MVCVWVGVCVCARVRMRVCALRHGVYYIVVSKFNVSRFWLGNLALSAERLSWVALNYDIFAQALLTHWKKKLDIVRHLLE